MPGYTRHFLAIRNQEEEENNFQAYDDAVSEQDSAVGVTEHHMYGTPGNPLQGPDQRYGMTHGWQCPEENLFDPYLAHHHTGAGINILGVGIEQITTKLHELALNDQRQESRDAFFENIMEARFSELFNQLSELLQNRQEQQEFHYEFNNFTTEFRTTSALLQQEIQCINNELAMTNNELNQLRIQFKDFREEFVGHQQDFSDFRTTGFYDDGNSDNWRGDQS